MLLGAGGAVTPLSRTVDGVLVGLELGFVLERDVALDGFLV